MFDRNNRWRWTAMLFLAVMPMSAVSASADTVGNPTTMPGTMDPLSVIGGSGTGATAIDMGPAMARAALAQAEYSLAQAQLLTARKQARLDFLASSDHQAAQKELNDAIAAREAAVDPVMDQLLQNSQYHEMVEERTEYDITLKSDGLSRGVRIELANKRLDLGNQIGQIESAALRKDSTVVAANARVAAAQAALAAAKDKFEGSLNTAATVVAAQKAVDQAGVNVAATEAYLAGANSTQAALSDSDSRHTSGGYGAQASPPTEAPDYPYNTGYGYPYGGYSPVNAFYNPYLYYGFGSPFFFPTVVTVTHSHHH